MESSLLKLSLNQDIVSNIAIQEFFKVCDCQKCENSPNLPLSSLEVIVESIKPKIPIFSK